MGGGQLGRMTSLAASKMGYRTHIFAERHDDPAVFVTNSSTIGSFYDHDKLSDFASAVDLSVIEFENIPTSAVDVVSAKIPVYPGKKALYIAQNRIREKQHIRNLGMQVADFAVANSYRELLHNIESIGYPCLLKTTEFGYDGRGQYVMKNSNDVTKAADLNWDQGHVLEKFVDIREEISVIVAMDANGSHELFPIARNYHVGGTLDESIVPAEVTHSISKKAAETAIAIATSLNIVGILAVEFFITTCGLLLVNEIAPRPHNSGHWSLDACNVSQFEQLIRAVCGLPLREVRLLAPCVMKNVFGDTSSVYQTYAHPHNSISIYGKQEPRQHRKMGHVNVLKY
ncbi:5-(carboxyamino)imidazole ribonucleotide synthase [Anaplasma capra]|uniref:5-(carboxyamino)imidazole ribonucleotide synthase n=1 Tax=Anaplasma capra TaxID=1562740 RepID=UPI0021D5DB06|nr:5-(carboxyamino)imidazole ribonucleotide synthase [Anaplasma capra]MCU7612627.1 5-(carboxyamino)imidazole ribonucleotide synthase [Anaplasma capra]